MLELFSFRGFRLLVRVREDLALCWAPCGRSSPSSNSDRFLAVIRLWRVAVRDLISRSVVLFSRKSDIIIFFSMISSFWSQCNECGPFSVIFRSWVMRLLLLGNFTMFSTILCSLDDALSSRLSVWKIFRVQLRSTTLLKLSL